MYRRLTAPDLLLVLRLEPDIAVARRREDDPAIVRSRNREIWEADWRATGAHVVDASQPADVVLASARAAIWTVL